MANAFGQGIGQFHFKANDVAGVLGIAKLKRRAAFGIAAPTERAAGQPLIELPPIGLGCTTDRAE